MTTKTSPWRTSNETSRTAAVQPVRARSSARGRVGVRRADGTSAFGPKTFHTPSARIAGELE